MRLGHNQRMLFADSSLYQEVISKLEISLGISIENMVSEAERVVGISFFKELTKNISLVDLAKRSQQVRNLQVNYFPRLAMLFGLCSTEEVEYHSREFTKSLLKNPYQLTSAAAILCGSLEFVDEVRYTSKYEKKSRNEYNYEFRKTDEIPWTADRLALEAPPVVPGNVMLKKCPKCGVPLEISRKFKWIEGEGLILECHTGTRFSVFSGYRLDSLIRELVNELGDEIYEMVVSATSDMVRKNWKMLGLDIADIGDRPEDLEYALSEYIGNMPVYGWGNPVSFEPPGSSLKLTVENPFNVHILAGSILGLFELLSGGKCKITWESQREGIVAYSIVPA